MKIDKWLHFRLVFTTEAKGSLKKTASYYNRQLKGLGKGFANEVQRKLAVMKQHPYVHSVRNDNIRLAPLNKFPYSIHYTIIQNQVIVLKINCDHNDPSEHWIKGKA